MLLTWDFSIVELMNFQFKKILLKLKHHLGKFAARENNPLYSTYVCLKCYGQIERWSVVQIAHHLQPNFVNIKYVSVHQPCSMLSYTGMAKVKLVIAIRTSRVLLVHNTTSMQSMLMLRELEECPKEIFENCMFPNRICGQFIILFENPCDNCINLLQTTINTWFY